LAQGEYVAAEYLETVYLKSKFVSQIFVYGSSYKNHLVAIIVPDEEILLPFAKHNNIPGDTTALSNNPIIKRTIYADLAIVGSHAKVKGFEKIKNIHISPTPWTTETGELTPTMKMKRNILQQKYEQVIEQLYKEEFEEGGVKPKL